MKLSPKRFYQSGDTIVEVLIAIAIISSVLAGAFLVTQKSTVAVRDSQERGEMLQLLQGQVELVRQLTISESIDTGPVPATSPYSTSPKYFCIDTDASSPNYQKRVSSPGLGGSLPPVNSDNYSGYDSACKNVQGRYNIAIAYEPGVFRLYGRWDRVQGGKDEVQLSYRVHPGNVPLTLP